MVLFNVVAVLFQGGNEWQNWYILQHTLDAPNGHHVFDDGLYWVWISNVRIAVMVLVQWTTQKSVNARYWSLPLDSPELALILGYLFQPACEIISL